MRRVGTSQGGEQAVHAGALRATNWCAPVALSFIGILLGAGPAQAQAKPPAPSITDINAALQLYQSEIQGLETEYREIPDVAGESKFEEWLSNGEIALLSGNYADASLLFYGAVEAPLGDSDVESVNRPGYLRAVAGLADSLYELGNFSGARYYYLLLLNRKENHDKREHALIRLIDIASRLRDDDAVHEYAATYRAQARGNPPSEVQYALAKSYFLSRQDEDAMDALVQVQVGDRYYMRARYLVGAIETRAGRLKEALAIYENIAADVKSVSPEDAKVKELAHLARGRLHYELDQLNEAVDAYQYVQIDSDQLATMLYEVIWTYVRRGSLAQRDEELKPRARKKAADAEYDKALERLRYLRYLQSEDGVSPDISILMGNLQIQRENYAGAESSFNEVLDVYGPADEEMRRLIADPSERGQLLQEIIALESGGLAADAKLPPLAARRASENREVAEALRLFKEIQVSRDEVAASIKVLEKLETALNQNNRTELFREVAGPLSRSQTVQTQLLQLEGQITELKRASVEGRATSEQRERLASLRQRTEELRGKLDSIATDTTQLDDRKSRFQNRLMRVENEASRIRTELKGMREQLKAADKLLADVKRASAASPLELQNMRKELSYFNKQLKEFEALEKALLEEAEDIRTALKLSGGRGSSEEGIREAYELAVKEENQLLDEILGPQAAQFATASQQVKALKDRNGRFKGRVDAVVDKRTADLQRVLDVERNNLEAYALRIEAVNSEAAAFRDAATAIALEHVRSVLDQIVVRADVGLIDVAWAKKNRETQKIGQLQRAKAAELTDLNQAYADLTRDEAGE
jgi:DNA repair exonuclease SbcCD ATPase subunit